MQRSQEVGTKVRPPLAYYCVWSNIECSIVSPRPASPYSASGSQTGQFSSEEWRVQALRLWFGHLWPRRPSIVQCPIRGRGGHPENDDSNVPRPRNGRPLHVQEANPGHRYLGPRRLLVLHGLLPELLRGGVQSGHSEQEVQDPRRQSLRGRHRRAYRSDANRRRQGPGRYDGGHPLPFRHLFRPSFAAKETSTEEEGARGQWTRRGGRAQGWCVPDRWAGHTADGRGRTQKARRSQEA
mmetsp:Transcript_28366/g.62345  ORF Transcript_28366/g.62345 Transcript_28366/m.62345 type:complete len:239 (-) Transcript_28366:596-1312(-)